MSDRRCVFCGSPFSGQKRNFEHIIPDWLVDTADLRRRTMEVYSGRKRLTVAMNRIGARSCVSCNDVSSNLEGQAKSVFQRLQSNQTLRAEDIQILFDWLDKVRVGLWLWLLHLRAKHHSIQPKFRIADRIGTKDRLVAIARYIPGPPMRGLELWGVTRLFELMPSVLGLLVNNIVLITVSSDFVIARHLGNLRITRKVYSSGPDELDVTLASEREHTFSFLGQPHIYGQSIFPSELGSAFSFIQAKPSVRHPHLSEGPVIKFNSGLVLNPEPLGSINTTIIDPRTHTTLMEINTITAANFLARDMLKSEFSFAENPSGMRRNLEYYKSTLREQLFILNALRDRYRRLTGIILPA